MPLSQIDMVALQNGSGSSLQVCAAVLTESRVTHPAGPLASMSSFARVRPSPQAKGGARTMRAGAGSCASMCRRTSQPACKLARNRVWGGHRREGLGGLGGVQLGPAGGYSTAGPLDDPAPD
jgi:hypothetical protein